jgi:DNA polymerase
MNEQQILELIQEEDPENPIAYVHDIVRDYARQKLDKYIIDCRDCDGCSDVKSLTKGPTDADVMIIGESVPIEEYESKSSLPFDQSRVLDSVLQSLNVNPDSIFYINAVNCCLIKKVGTDIVSRTPFKSEVENCSVFLDYAIELVKPLLIITLGSIATNVYYKGAITKVRGQWTNIKGIPAIPTYHPEYFAHIEGKKDPELIEMQKWEFVEDLKNAFSYLQEKYPENNTLIGRIE